MRVCGCSTLTPKAKGFGSITICCSFNKIICLEFLPSNLINLWCSHNYIIYLDDLPSTLIKLQFVIKIVCIIH